MTAIPCILYRTGVSEESEERAARAVFPVYRYRAQVPCGSLVVGRYSVLPFADELEKDLELLGSTQINTLAQHRYIADLDYYEDFKDVTFPTWFRFSDVPTAVRSQPFVVKGRTNSRKFDWPTKMFAADFQQAVRIGSELLTDGLIGQQGIVLRQYVPLETFEVSVTGLPLTNEWRVFYYKGKRLVHGFYWGNLDDWSAVERATPDFEEHGLPFADALAQRVKNKVPFVVLDIAKTQDGRWILVELNDGCQSGLNGVLDATVLYAKLAKCLADDPSPAITPSSSLLDHKGESPCS